MKENLFRCLDFLNEYGITNALRLVIKFIIDLIIVLSVATFFMRFCIIVGWGQTVGLIVGMALAVGANAYLRFKNKL